MHALPFTNLLLIHHVVRIVTSVRRMDQYAILIVLPLRMVDEIQEAAQLSIAPNLPALLRPIGIVVKKGVNLCMESSVQGETHMKESR